MLKIKPVVLHGSCIKMLMVVQKRLAHGIDELFIRNMPHTDTWIEIGQHAGLEFFKANLHRLYKPANPTKEVTNPSTTSNSPDRPNIDISLQMTNVLVKSVPSLHNSVVVRMTEQNDDGWDERHVGYVLLAGQTVAYRYEAENAIDLWSAHWLNDATDDKKELYDQDHEGPLLIPVGPFEVDALFNLLDQSRTLVDA